jgi:D-alanine-D-alanine ligase
MNRKIRLALVYGGRSGEHDVSVLTAFSVIQAIDFDNYEVTPFFITKDGYWLSEGKLVAPLQSVESLTFPGTSRKDAERSHPGLSNKLIDVVFPLLHGTFGEDGTIQGLFEMLDIPYVGSGVLASAVGMDKVMMKKVFAQAGLPQCLFRHFTRAAWEADRDFYIMEIESSIGYPCFVKPANLGSSVGISKVRDRDQLIEAVRQAFVYDLKVIVEENIDAREIEVGVLGNEYPQASIAGEIVSSNEFYDYHAKYIDGKSQMLIPASISDELQEQCKQMAIQAFLALEASGLSRVDFFLEKTTHHIYINEINTMPGFTAFSMYPTLWKHTGKSYPQLLDELIQHARARYATRQSIQYTFDHS